MNLVAAGVCLAGLIAFGDLLAQEKRAAKKPEPPASVLTHRVDLNFEATPLSDVVSFIQTLTQSSIVLDPNLKDPKLREKLITLTLTDVSMDCALDIILGRSLGYRIKDGVIIISDTEKPTPSPQDPKEEARIQAALKEKKMDVQFEATPLQDVVSYLKTLTDTNMVLDPNVTDTDVREKLITLSLKQVSLSTVLDLLVGKDLEYVIKGNVIVIMAKQGK
jgi:type II secretory pathway component GspD/PulD (secretin)